MYDAIVVGARCAGSPTAMLLAREGFRVLLVDRADFPSDTISAHAIHVAGQADLQRWGLLRGVLDTGCPQAERMHFDLGPLRLVGAPPAADGISSMIAPRRTVLDALLVEAAAEAGAEVRERFTVTGLVEEDGRVVGVQGRSAGGTPCVERAAIVVGADGPSSPVARMVDAPVYEDRGRITGNIYSYWSDVDVRDVELYVRPGRFFVAVPTNDGLTVVNTVFPVAEAPALRADPAAAVDAAVAEAPEFADRLRAGRRVERFRFLTDLPNRFRRPWGPGWALVGDAGYVKDPITAQGMTDAFRDAGLLSAAVVEGLSGDVPIEAALREYEQRRNEEAMAQYELATDLARLEPPPPHMQALFAALAGNQTDTDRFFGVMAGTVRVEDFFSDANVGSILERAA